MAKSEDILGKQSCWSRGGVGGVALLVAVG